MNPDLVLGTLGLRLSPRIGEYCMSLCIRFCGFSFTKLGNLPIILGTGCAGLFFSPLIETVCVAVEFRHYGGIL